MRGLNDKQPSDLILDPNWDRSYRPDDPVPGLTPPVQAGSWADALRRQVASLQAAGNEYREEIHRLRGLLADERAEVSRLRSDLAAERGGPVGGIEVRLMGPQPLREFLQLQLCISEQILAQGGYEAIRHLCRTAEHRLAREYERRGVAAPT